VSQATKRPSGSRPQPTPKKRSAPPRATRSAAAPGAEQQHADRTLRWVVLAVVLVVAAGIGGTALFLRGGSDTPTETVGAAVPSGVDPNTFAVPVSSNAAASTTAPQLEVWEDFQCPSCKLTEDANGAHIVELARGGTVNVLWRPTTFLDDNLSNDSSLRATAAWGCAIDAGKAVEYHAAVFAAQPATEGDGFTDAQLLRLGTQSGISGAARTTFKACVAEGRYQGWAKNSTAAFHKAQVAGTPAAYLDGHQLDNGVLGDATKLDAAVHKAWQLRNGDDMSGMDMDGMDMSGTDG
jgi:protein-disulfide isomerase